jgi:phenolic acid decarboxylase
MICGWEKIKMTKNTKNSSFKTTVDHPVPPQDLSGLVGHRFIYTYANGWQYEMYVKNATTIDYRIHSGMVGGRWVKGQKADIVQLDDDTYKVSWAEPTGTTVCVDIMPGKRRLHGTIFFPQWITKTPEKTILFQNDFIDQMHKFRDEGPTYPIAVVPEFACITLFEHVGADDETVISKAPGELEADFSKRTN